MLNFNETYTSTVGPNKMEFTFPCTEYKGVKVLKIDKLIEIADFSLNFNGEDICIGLDNDGTTPLIFVYEYLFNKLQDKESAEFFLEHELGHYYLGHLFRDNAEQGQNSRGRDYVIPEELEADQYAAEVLGLEHSIKVMGNHINHFKEVMGWPDNNFSVKELLMRLEALKQLRK